ncbi:MAG: hypothetical protein JWO22_2935 [Frankiales bacterium]|nr:hypothetical protein [Frankiales bacterium]
MRIPRVAAVAALLTAPVLLAGCSSDSSTVSAPSTTPAPEAVTTSPQAVTAGLQQIAVIATQVKAQIADSAAATKADGGIEPIWSTIEGTVKGHDADTYLAFEDAFALLEDAAKTGDATKATSAVAAIEKSVTAYTAKYPS